MSWAKVTNMFTSNSIYNAGRCLGRIPKGNGRLVVSLIIVLVGVLASFQSPSLLTVGSGSQPAPAAVRPNASTYLSYTVSLSGADKTTLSIDGGKPVEFSKTKTVTLDGSKPHSFQVQQIICQSGWECGDQVSDWTKGKRLVAKQWIWTVQAGTLQTTSYPEVYLVPITSCYTDSHGSYYCYTLGYYTYTRWYTQSTFTPPCKPCAFTFEYTPQYRLVLEDEQSNVGLYEWYYSCAPVQLATPAGYPALGHPDTVAGPPGVRYAFNGWRIDDTGPPTNQVTMCAPHKATATYLTQYLLQVGTGCNELNPRGGGWINEGETATIAVDPQAPMPGWQGWLGGRVVFDGWEERPGGNLAFQDPIANVVMNQPHDYFARCRADILGPIIGGGIITIIIILGGMIAICWITGGRFIICRILGPLGGGGGPPGGGGGGGVGPPGLPPNATGPATATGPDGAQTPLNAGNLSQVGPGTTIDTGLHSFVRVPTPKASSSQSTIGQNSRVGWLDPNPNTPIPWLRFPGLSQIYNLGSLLLRLDFGKLLLSWVQAAAAQEAVIILPASLIGAAASAAMSRWLARIKGTMVLVEATDDGTAAAITVLQGEEDKESSVELWRSDDLNKVIEVHAGERVILKAGRRPSKVSVGLAKSLTQQIQDPFGTLHKWWTLPPMSEETSDALKTPSQIPSGPTTGDKISFCTNCGRNIPSDLKFCTYCGQKLEVQPK